MPTAKNLPPKYDPCYCGSGKKYGFCHYPVDVASAEDRRELSQKIYVGQWSRNADFFRGQGCYTWMASQLARYSPKVVLDVGCGDGTGILAAKAACTSNPRIIACDDNFHCLETARDKIKLCGLDVKVIQRMRQSRAGAEFHEMQIEPGKLNIPAEYADITLVEADIIWDAEFLEFLESSPPFDAITVWLIGTYHLKPECRNVKAQPAPLYRLTVQNKVYEIADKILRTGGVLQIVDRGESPKEEFLIKDTLQAHREQAQGTSLEVVEHQFKDYEEPPRGTGVSMVQVIGTSGRLPSHRQLAMTSVISIKR